MKTAVLTVLGWRVLRFQNQEVLENPAACARRVLDATGEVGPGAAG
jgi:very-short-patch-repair endonuclease